MSRNRESNYDILRILSAFGVVLLHVSGSFLQCDEGKVPLNCHFPVMLLNHLVRFAVPCFLMLSGAFLLAEERNADYQYFYRKSFRNIGITGGVFCLLYVLYRAAKLLAGVLFRKHAADALWPGLMEMFKSLLTGQPFFHLWYLFTLLGLYFAVPVVIRLAADLRAGGVNLYGKITTWFLALASISYITSEHQLRWDIGWQFCFLSYFFMGYKLRQWGQSRKNNRTALLLILSGIAVNGLLAWINYLRGQNGLPVDTAQYDQNPFSYAPLAPIEVIASCLIFAGFSVLDIKKDVSKLAKDTFLIYLFHAGVWDVLSFLLGERLLGNPAVEAVAALGLSGAVFLLSLLGARLYRKLPTLGSPKGSLPIP